MNAVLPEKKLVIKKQFSNPALWNPEAPNLYQVKVSIKDNKGVVHTITHWVC